MVKQFCPKSLTPLKTGGEKAISPTHTLSYVTNYIILGLDTIVIMINLVNAFKQPYTATLYNSNI